MLERARGLAGFLVLAREVVVRGGVTRVDLERAAEAALRVARAGPTAFCASARLTNASPLRGSMPQRLARLRGRGVEPSEL